MEKKTRIVATLGTKMGKNGRTVDNKQILTKLIQKGLNVIRLNFSHITQEKDRMEIKELVRIVREEINEELGTNVCFLQDLQGPKIRVGKMNTDIYVKDGDTIIITTHILDNTYEGKIPKIFCDYEYFCEDVEVGHSVFINDGYIEMRVKEKDMHKKEVTCSVINGGKISSHKGINLPQTLVKAASLTPDDENDLHFGIEVLKVEWVAISFVKTGADIIDLRNKINDISRNAKQDCPKIIAKIETPEALKNIDSIIKETDAIMVARGDLAVETPLYNVPILQKEMIKKCNANGKAVIVATQMLESMITNPRPTRAEVSDVANAVLDGADAVMLSGETSATDALYHVEVVETMAKIIQHTEQNLSDTKINGVEIRSNIYNKIQKYPDFSTESRSNDELVRGACIIAKEINATKIIATSRSGYTGLRIAIHRPECDIFIFSENRFVVKMLNLIWGINTFYIQKRGDSLESTFDIIRKKLLDEKKAKTGEKVVFITDSFLVTEKIKGFCDTIKIEKI
ncbi:MAG: pyruvate kinase [Chitinophagaceae bacterium]|nr:pyruvate kinase [Chitinophagaceae bacterium]